MNREPPGQGLRVSKIVHTLAAARHDTQITSERTSSSTSTRVHARRRIGMTRGDALPPHATASTEEASDPRPHTSLGDLRPRSQLLPLGFLAPGEGAPEEGAVSAPLSAPSRLVEASLHASSAVEQEIHLQTTTVADVDPSFCAHGCAAPDPEQHPSSSAAGTLLLAQAQQAATLTTALEQQQPAPASTGPPTAPPHARASGAQSSCLRVGSSPAPQRISDIAVSTAAAATPAGRPVGFTRATSDTDGDSSTSPSTPSRVSTPTSTHAACASSPPPHAPPNTWPGATAPPRPSEAVLAVQIDLQGLLDALAAQRAGALAQAQPEPALTSRLRAATGPLSALATPAPSTSPATTLLNRRRGGEDAAACVGGHCAVPTPAALEVLGSGATATGIPGAAPSGESEPPSAAPSLPGALSLPATEQLEDGAATTTTAAQPPATAPTTPAATHDIIGQATPPPSQPPPLSVPPRHLVLEGGGAPRAPAPPSLVPPEQPPAQAQQQLQLPETSVPARGGQQQQQQQQQRPSVLYVSPRSGGMGWSAMATVKVRA